MTKTRFRYVRNRDWDRYKHIVQKFLEDDSGRQTVAWCRNIDQPLFMGEDVKPKYELVPIEVLCYYNAFRNWPINKATVSGELDDENLVILIPKSSITDYLNTMGYFKFNWSEDRFIINGISYKPDGDTEVAQAKDEAIVFQIIIKRDRDTKFTEDDFVNPKYYELYNNPNKVNLIFEQPSGNLIAESIYSQVNMDNNGNIVTDNPKVTTTVSHDSDNGDLILKD